MKNTGTYIKVKYILFSSILACTSSTITMADANTKIATEKFSGSTVSFSVKNTAKNTTLSISGPSGFYAVKSSNDGVPSIDLFDFGTPGDGHYKYQITASTIGVGKSQARDALNNGRTTQTLKTAKESLSQSGHFYVEDSQIKHFDN